MAKKAVAKKKRAPIEYDDEEIESKNQYGARQSKATVCPFCEHSYIKPCTNKTKDGCPNYLHLQSRGKGKK